MSSTKAGGSGADYVLKGARCSAVLICKLWHCVCHGHSDGHTLVLCLVW